MTVIAPTGLQNLPAGMSVAVATASASHIGRVFPRDVDAPATSCSRVSILAFICSLTPVVADEPAFAVNAPTVMVICSSWRPVAISSRSPSIGWRLYSCSWRVSLRELSATLSNLC